ncbi:MAG: hypothetical protein ACMUIA_12420 [bacterium]
MEIGASREQIIKVMILAGILGLVLIFKGPIQKGIYSFRKRAKSAASVPSTRRRAAPAVPKPGDNLVNKNLADESLMKELAEASRPREAISPGEDEWPECIKRDIFAFPKAPEPVRKAPASYSEPKRARRIESKTEPTLEDIKAKLHLEATVTGGQPMAVINNKPLTVEQSILGCKVMDIQEGKVTLTRNGRKFSLP